MNLNSRESVISRLRRGKGARCEFIESHLAKGIAYQIRATRDKLEWSQERLAAEAGMNQNAISRLESPNYGKPTLTTLKRVAAAMDIGLIVRFVPFSELVDWVTGTPRTVTGLSTASLAINSFSTEYNQVSRVNLGAGAVACAREKYLASDQNEVLEKNNLANTLDTGQVLAHQSASLLGGAATAAAANVT